MDWSTLSEDELRAELMRRAEREHATRPGSAAAIRAHGLTVVGVQDVLVTQKDTYAIEVEIVAESMAAACEAWSAIECRVPAGIVATWVPGGRAAEQLDSEQADR